MDSFLKNHPALMQNISSFFPILSIGVIFYFFLIRPQQKKAKKHLEMISSLKKGDRVITQGGLVGKVVRVLNNREFSLELSDGVHITVLKEAIRGTYKEVLEEGEGAGKKA